MLRLDKTSQQQKREKNNVVYLFAVLLNSYFKFYFYSLIIAAGFSQNLILEKCSSKITSCKDSSCHINGLKKAMVSGLYNT